MALLDALHLKTIFANVGRQMKGLTDETISKWMESIASAPDYYKKSALADIGVLRKGKSLISEDLGGIEQKIDQAFKTSDAKLLSDIVNQHGKAIAVVLAVGRASWDNQKLLWLHTNEGENHVRGIDEEIARIDELAKRLKLTLPSLQVNVAQLEAKHDYHYTLRGSYGVPVDTMYGLVLYNIKKTDFLRLVEADEAARKIRFASDRREDPRGIMEVTITPVDQTGGSYFRLRIEDEEFLAVVRAGGLQARYGTERNYEDTIGALLTKEPAGAKDRENIHTALKTYGQMIFQAPQLRQFPNEIPGGKEVMEMVEFVEKYKDVYTAEKAKKIADEIQGLRYSVDAQERLAAMVKEENFMIAISLLAYKKSLQLGRAMNRELPPNRIQGQVQYFEEALRIVDETAKKYDLDLASIP